MCTCIFWKNSRSPCALGILVPRGGFNCLCSMPLFRWRTHANGNVGSREPSSCLSGIVLCASASSFPLVGRLEKYSEAERVLAAWAVTAGPPSPFVRTPACAASAPPRTRRNATTAAADRVLGHRPRARRARVLLPRRRATLGKATTTTTATPELDRHRRPAVGAFGARVRTWLLMTSPVQGCSSPRRHPVELGMDACRGVHSHLRGKDQG